MSCKILVYKQGSKSEIRGVKCEFKRIDIGELDKHLSVGYVKSLDELTKTKTKKIKAD